jgi:hypothetical protein
MQVLPLHAAHRHGEGMTGSLTACPSGRNTGHEDGHAIGIPPAEQPIDDLLLRP